MTRIFESYNKNFDLTIDNIEDKQLKFFIHDKGGWIFSTKNVVVALHLLYDKTLKDIGEESEIKILDILNSKVRYNKELIISSLEEDGDLQWISWLCNGAFDYGNDTERLYDYVMDDVFELGLDDEKEDEEVNRRYDILMESYDSDDILEKIKNDYEDELIEVIEKSDNYLELAEEINRISEDITQSSIDYLLDFMCECSY